MKALFKSLTILTVSLSILVWTVRELPTAYSESLFKAHIEAQAPTVGLSQDPNASSMMPRSLFSPPVARRLGDIVTINFKDVSQSQINAAFTNTSSQIVQDSSTPLINQAIQSVAGRIIGSNTVLGKVNQLLNVPSFDGVNNKNNTTHRLQTLRNTQLTDTIACQVVEVLPNGNLIVQGVKRISQNKEQTDLMVTGMVNPFYLNGSNEIGSNYVSNLQFVKAGKGVVSRGQNDGIINKIYSLLH
ncbi:MAG: flagellar basal body L-ring protein FlgH [Vampirovibrionales bacterium]